MPTETAAPTETETETKPKRATWRDWQPDPKEEQPLYTIDQFISRLQGLGHNVTANNIRHWRAVGALPAPTRQWYGTAVHAVYPEWLFNLVPYLIRFRQDGMAWPEVSERLRAMVPEMIARQPTATVTVRPPELATLDDAILAFAAQHEAITGTPIARAELRLFDAEGKQRGRRTYDTQHHSTKT